MRLGEVFRVWRVVHERDLRSIAREMGTSASTLSRFERGEEVTSTTLSRILLWLFTQDNKHQLAKNLKLKTIGE